MKINFIDFPTSHEIETECYVIGGHDPCNFIVVLQTVNVFPSSYQKDFNQPMWF